MPKKKQASRIPDTLAALTVPLADLRPYPRNPRHGDTDAIAASLRVNGQFRPIVVRQSDHTILAGNHTYAAALSLGWTEIAATFVDVDDEQAARIVLVDNRTNDLALGYDDNLLLSLLQDLPDLEGTGYDQAALDALLAASVTPLDDWPAIEENTQHAVTLHYTDEDEYLLLRFLGRDALPSPEHLGRDIMEAICRVAQEQSTA